MTRQPFDSSWPTLPAAVMLWILSGVLLLSTLGGSSINRVQEARVLVSAQSMIGQPMERWMIPMTNGAVRLRKPPLAYWLAAVSMTVMGQTDVAGRVPFALAAWGTLGLVFVIGKKLYNPRMGFLSAAMLMGTWLFAKFSRLAETDTLVTFWFVLGVYVILSCLSSTTTAKRALLWVVLGLVMGLALLAKGPQAAVLLLVFVVLSLLPKKQGDNASSKSDITKNTVIGSLVSLGVCLLIAGPWFLYIRHHPEFSQLTDDLENSAGGGKGHSGWFYVYFYMIPQYALPWSAVMLLSVLPAWKTFIRKDASMQVIIVWILAVFVPLCFWGNKQFQYLMPLMPANMLLAGWLLDRLLSAVDAAETKLTHMVISGTVFISLFAAPAIIYVAHHERHAVLPLDIAVSLLWITISGMSWLLLMRNQRAMAAIVYTTGVAVCISAMIGLFAPTLDSHSPRSVAMELQEKFKQGKYVFREDEFLPLCFYMKQVIPIAETDEDLIKDIATDPQLLAIERNKPESMKPIPAGLVEVSRFEDEDRVYRVLGAASR